MTEELEKGTATWAELLAEVSVLAARVGEEHDSATEQLAATDQGPAPVAPTEPQEAV